jgi:prevent-host-death family protein
MKITATEFKAKSLALIDRVHETGEPIIITKRGRVVARLVADGDSDTKPWIRVRGCALWNGDPLQPAIDESEVEALR